MDISWKQDPRLEDISPEKLTLLTQFAEQIERTDKNHLMEAFMTVNLEAQEKGL